MKNLLISAALMATVTLSGCAGSEAKTDSYAGIVAAANTAHADAKTSGFVWKQKKMKLSYVEDYLAKAEAAKAKGDEAGAMANAKAALKTANAEVAQRDSAKGLKAGWEK